MARLKPQVSAASKCFADWIYGHDHSWHPGFSAVSWGQAQVVQTLALPSTGLWGDIGYVVFRTGPDGAVAELFQDDFYFTTPDGRPPFWRQRIADNAGSKVHFAF